MPNSQQSPVTAAAALTVSVAVAFTFAVTVAVADIYIYFKLIHRQSLPLSCWFQKETCPDHQNVPESG